ncbi:hypothetical protein BC830DRAFT_1107750 [Chytriomyces sp. MP71]|nr:hypothetical protein BC830DRAFT_1107750 [Chytriomyces sp. MP71]
MVTFLEKTFPHLLLLLADFLSPLSCLHLTPASGTFSTQAPTENLLSTSSPAPRHLEASHSRTLKEHSRDVPPGSCSL